jgi:hypothetical protein
MTRSSAPHPRRPWLWLAVAFVLCTAVVAPTPTVLGKSGQDAPFSSDELALLREGKLVKRAAKENRGSLQLMGGTSWQLIGARPEVVFRALLDTTKYKHMLPAVTNSTLVNEAPGTRVVRLEHKKGPVGVTYDVRARYYPERGDITFLLERAPKGAPRAAWGFFSVRPYGRDLTLLSYGVMADPGDGILVGLLRGVVHDWILQVPRQVKKYVESSWGRARYAETASVEPAQP